MDNDKTIKETDFNPLPLYRGRLILAQNPSTQVTFQSTSSIQRKTLKTTNDSLVVVFQSTSSIQRKTLLDFPSRHRRGFQSTSSIQRKTYPRLYSLYCWWHFNPLPLYRGRQRHKLKRLQRWVFQSTSSIQRKTLVIIPAIAYNIFQSTSSIQRKTANINK